MKEEKVSILIEEIKENMAVLKRAFNQCFYQSEPKLSRHQIFCLHFLEKSDTLSMSELAEKVDVSNQQLTRIIDSLVESGHVERAVSPENRRIVLVKISKQGINFVQKSDNQIRSRASVLLASLSEQDIDHAIEHIRALKSIIYKLK